MTPDPVDSAHGGKTVQSYVLELTRKRLGDRWAEFEIPPPVFKALQAEILAYDAEQGVLRVRFPVLKEYLNPYGSLQGGIVAALVDNVLGPLSMLVAPPNVTRRLEMKYSRPVMPEMGHVVVTGTFLEREGRWLRFRADVRTEDGLLLARAQASHWMVDDEPTD